MRKAASVASEPTSPSAAIVKRLFAHSGNRCAFPKCPNSLVTGETIIGEICHIEAASPTGPRYNENQTPAQRHGYDNLILLCANHHKVIDDDAEAYTVQRLAKMKADHQNSAGRVPDEEATTGAEMLISVGQSGGIAAHTIHTINVHVPPEKPVSPPNALPVSAGMTFFDTGEVLASMGYPGEQEFTFDSERFAYLRLIPSSNQPRVGLARILEVFKQGKPCPMSDALSGAFCRNKHGAIIFEAASSHAITSFTQGFASGELWGMNGKLFQFQRHQVFPTEPVGETYIVPTVAMEKLYVLTLGNYAQLASSELHLKPPYTVELGIRGLKDAQVSFPRHPAGRLVGPIYEEAFRRTFSLSEPTTEAISDLLRRYFNEFYEELVGCKRAEELTSEFAAAHGLPALK